MGATDATANTPQAYAGIAIGCAVLLLLSLGASYRFYSSGHQADKVQLATSDPAEDEASIELAPAISA